MQPRSTMRRQFKNPLSHFKLSLPGFSMPGVTGWPEEPEWRQPQTVDGQVTVSDAWPQSRTADGPITPSDDWQQLQSGEVPAAYPSAWRKPQTGEVLVARPAGWRPQTDEVKAVRPAKRSWRKAKPGPRRPPLSKKARRKKRVRRWTVVVVSILLLLGITLSQGNGAVGAWSADAIRGIAGPVAAAQVEAWYNNVQNQITQTEYKLGLQHIKAPTMMKTATMKATPPVSAALTAMPLKTIPAMVTPALDGEGEWSVLETAAGKYSYLPMDAQSFIRPDPNYNYAVVSLLKFDSRFMRMHLVAGTGEPGGTLKNYGTGIVDPADQTNNALLATFNGGFKYADGAFGLMTDGKVYVPPQQKAATLAITKEGKIFIGAWGVDPLLTLDNQDLLAWRQNASLLINNGLINSLANDGAAWGGTILNSEYTWRSGLGITAQGDLIYAAGNALLPLTLGKALKAAGAVMAMEGDINPFWTRAFLYQQTEGTYTITKLNSQMQGTGYEYLKGDLRDFFYLTRYTIPATTTTPKKP